MKNIKTRMTRLIVIFASLVMLLSTAVALPISADAPGSDPILSGTEYGVTYDNGVYTISIDAERLAEILSSQSFNKETLKSVLPEKVYDLIVNRDKEAITALLTDLIDTVAYGQLKEDLPIDLIRDHFSAEDILSIVNVDNFMQAIDKKAILSSLDTSDASEVEKIFLEGKLDGLLKSLDLGGLENLSLKEILDVISLEELVDEMLKQNRQGFVESLNIPYIIKLDAVQTELRALTVAEVKTIIDFDAVQNELIPKTIDLFINNFESIFINQTPVYVNPGKLDLAKIDYAMLDAFPTFDKIANVGENGEIASFVLGSSVNGEAYFLGFKVKLTGDTTAIKEYAQKLTERFSFIVNTDGSINTKIKLPAKAAELYISAIDTDKLPDTVKNKLKDIANVEFNKSDISDLGEAIIQKLTIAELKDLLSAIDVGSIDDKLLSQLNLRESQVQIILDYSIKAINKIIPIIENSPEAETILSTFYDKTIADFYTGNGTFEVDVDYFYDPIELAEKVTELPEKFKEFVTGTRIEHHTNTVVTFEGLYSVEYVENGETFYTGFRTEGYDLSKVTSRPAFAGKGANGWGNADGVQVDVMPAEDTKLAKIYVATFIALDSQGATVKEFPISFTELSNAEELIKKPEDIEEIPHYTFTWDDFTIKNEDFTVYGRYTPIEYTVTFKADGNTIDTQIYTIENKNITVPAVPAKDHYTGEWSDYTLDNGGNIEVVAEYTPIEYTVTFKADGNVIDTQTYTFEDKAITEPSVPDKQYYENGRWADYELNFENITVEAIYDAIEYTVTFKADGNVIDTQTYTFENKTITEPAVPAKQYYENGRWADYDLNFENITVEAEYDAIKYSVTFMADGNTVDVKYYTVESPSITEPDVPAKDGYTGAWETYTLNFENIVVNAKYTEIGTVVETYYITFVDENGGIISKLEFDRNTDLDTLKAPATVPTKLGYNVYWPEFKSKIFDDAIFEQTGTYSFEVKAVYEIITYSVKFWYSETEFKTVTYTIEDLNNGTVKMPDLPAADKGYSVNWSIDRLPLADTEATLVYSLIDYYITFVSNGSEIKIKFNINTDPATIVPPSPIAIKGFSAYWPTYKLFDETLYDATGSYNQTVTAKYALITYYATFVDKNGKEVAKVPFTVTDSSVTAPAVPTLAGYNVSWPEFTVLDENRYANTGTYNFTVRAEYEIITYTVTFKADGVVVGTQTYTVENKKITEPAVPEKEGFIGSWENYTLDTGDKTVNAVYIAIVDPDITYYITFVDCDGNVIEKVPFTINTDPSTVKAPIKVPEKAGYSVAWPSFNLFDEDRFTETGSYSFTVEAVYTPIQYTATFVVDGKVVAEIPFTVETESLEEPTIPAKAGYSASWSKYTLGTEDITIDAVYSTISYTVTFIADGKEVAVLHYTVENPTIEEPAVPEKEGYTGEWEEYTLDIGNKEVHAIYTEDAVDDEESTLFWWIMTGILVAAGIAVVVVYKTMTKKKSDDEK